MLSKLCIHTTAFRACGEKSLAHLRIFKPPPPIIRPIYYWNPRARLDYKDPVKLMKHLDASIDTQKG